MGDSKTVRRKSSVGVPTEDKDDAESEADSSSDDDGTDMLRNLPKRLREVESTAVPHHHERRRISLAVQFSLLMCKCMKMIWSYKILAGIEVLVPMVAVFITYIYTATLELDNDPKPIIYSPFGYDPVTLKSCKVIYIPKTSAYVDDIISDLTNDRRDTYSAQYSYSTTVDFEERLNDGSLCAVINFKNLPPNRSDPLPNMIEYELRLPAVPKDERTEFSFKKSPIISTWQPQRVYPSGMKIGPRNRFDNTGGSPGYYSEGFLYLQHKIDCLLLRLIYADLPNYGQLPRDVCSDFHVFPHFQRFPYPPHQHVNLMGVVTKWLPFILTLSYAVLFSGNTWLLVKEKEVGMKGFLEYYNVSPWKQWLSWVTYRMVLHALALIPIAYGLTGPWANNRAVINKSTTGAIYFFLLTYVFNCICTSCLFSTFFYKAQTASAIAVAVWFLSYLPSVRVDYDIAPNIPRPNDQYFSLLAATIYCLSSNLALSYGFQVIFNSETNSKGVSMDTFLTERFDLGHVIVCLNTSSLLSILLAMYMERVSPTSNAREEPMPLLFFLSGRFWRNEQMLPKVKPTTTPAPVRTMEETHEKFFERNPRKKDRGVEIILNKATRALNGGDIGIFKINLRCLSGEIVAVLGAPKSGKTAFCYVCAGLLPVTSGAVFLKKRNLMNFMGYARSNIGLCPQVDALYEYLTVEEHFSFFVQLKGVVIAADAYEEIENLIIGLDLEDIRKVRAKDLSPGQKRLVHIGIAFASGSKIVLLDEPTAGMDVTMKRTAWRFFDSERSMRTILLFTKDTEEASYVGDRVLALINGEVYVRGTPAFIKTTFDGGYQLELTTDPKSDPEELIAITNAMVPRSKVLYSGYQEVILLLPDECTPFFPSYFERLQLKKASLGIKEMNISFVPFEEILKKITKLTIHDVDLKTKSFSTHWKKIALFMKLMFPAKSKQQDFLEHKPERKCVNLLRQFTLHTVANFKFLMRRWKWNVFPLCISMFFALLGPICLETLGFSKLEPIGSVDLNFQNLENPRVLFKCRDDFKLHTDFCRSVRKALSDMGLHVDNATSLPMDDQLLGHYYQTVTAQDLDYYFAADVKFTHFENDVVLYFDNQPLHVLGAASRFFTKLIYNRMRAATFPPVPPEKPEHEIRVINHPLPYTVRNRLRIARSFLGPEPFPATALAWATMMYLSNAGALQLSAEKRFKTLLKTCGVNIYLFWLSKLAVSLSVFCVMAVVVGPTYYAFGVVGYDNFPMLLASFTIFMCYGVCAISLICLLSFIPFVVKNVRTTFFYMWTIAFVFGPIPWILLSFLTDELYDEQDTTRKWLRSVNQFLEFLPGHALAIAMHRASIISIYGSQCEKVKNIQALCRRNPNSHPCCDVEKGNFQSFGRFGLLEPELRLLSEAAFFFILIFILESSTYRSLVIRLKNVKQRWKARRVKQVQVHPVVNESKVKVDPDFDLVRFQSQDAQSVGCEVFINDLTKQVGDRTVLDHLSLGILKNQSFGFIGNEGSGQSSVVRIVAGLLHPTFGDVTIGDMSLNKTYSKYITQVACCPKQHMLLLELTGRETFMLIGTVKGISRQRLKELIRILSNGLSLDQILDKLVLHYDLGSRRKLSFALALIGNPRVLVLEEPFHEVDPESRDQMIKMLLQKRTTTTIVLSSSNMELAVSFCHRIALLIDGKLACMGSPDFLMTNYSNGVTIIIQLVPEDCSFYNKKGIVYHYSHPDDSETFETESDEPQGRQESTQGQASQDPKQTGPAIPAIVISGSDTEKAASLKQPRKKYLTRAPPGQAPPGQSSDGQATDGGSRSASTSSGSSRLSASSGAEDELWEQELDPIMEYMEDSFPRAALFDKSVCYLHYHLPGDDLDLSDIFKKMEIARIGFELEAYRVGTGRLTQLLGSYARGQAGTKEEDD